MTRLTRAASVASLEAAHTRILRSLLAKPDTFASGEFLSARLGISRSAVHKHIVRLRRSGYRIESQPRLGYKWAGSPATLDADAIRAHTRSRVVGSTVVVYNRIDSTNRAAADLGRLNGSDGAAVFAEEQTSGRGRLGRSWASPRSQGIYLSVLLRPRCDMDGCAPITLMASIAVCEALEEFSKKPIWRIKWPNDLYVGDRKLGGILTEISGEPDRVNFVVVGIGINVTGTPATLDAKAITFEEACGQTADRNLLAAAILTALERHYALFKKTGFASLANRWNQLSCVNGRQILVETAGQSFRGKARGVNEDGCLGVRDEAGDLRWIRSGDVRLCRSKETPAAREGKKS